MRIMSRAVDVYLIFKPLDAVTLVHYISEDLAEHGLLRTGGIFSTFNTRMSMARRPTSSG